MITNPATLIDGYKVDHRRQYPDNTQIIFSNLTARSTRRPNTDKVVFAGLQYFVKEYLIKQWNENFFHKPIDEVIVKFSNRINNYLGPNDVGEQHIHDLYNLGYLPVVILALPEGSEHPLKVPSLVLWNTDERFGWFTNYLETILSTSVWGMCTSATTAHQYKKLLNKYAAETVGDTDFVAWQGHDFSFRGMFGMEAACMSGAAHLFSFTGTDTIPAIDFLEQYYNADATKELVGGSSAGGGEPWDGLQFGHDRVARPALPPRRLRGGEAHHQQCLSAGSPGTKRRQRAFAPASASAPAPAAVRVGGDVREAPPAQKDFGDGGRQLGHAGVKVDLRGGVGGACTGEPARPPAQARSSNPGPDRGGKGVNVHKLVPEAHRRPCCAADDYGRRQESALKTLREKGALHEPPKLHDKPCALHPAEQELLAPAAAPAAATATATEREGGFILQRVVAAHVQYIAERRRGCKCK